MVFVIYICSAWLTCACIGQVQVSDEEYFLTLLKDHDYEFFKHLYTCYVRPVLESATQVWSPIQKDNIDRIETAQRYFTRHVIGPENFVICG